MYAKPLRLGPGRAAGPASVQTETAFAVLGTMPLAILAIEAVIGFILVLVSVLFFATIFFAFVGFILLYVALWIGVMLNGLGIAASLLILLAGRRYMTGKVFGISGLLIHLVLLGVSICGLASVHNYLAKAQDGPLQQPKTYSVPSPELRPVINVSWDLPTSSDMRE